MQTKRIVEQYHEDGFVIVRQLFSADEIATLDQHLRDFISDVVPTLDSGDVYFEDTPNRPVKSIFRLEEHDPYFQQLADDRRIRDLVTALLGDADFTRLSTGFFGKAAGDGSVVPCHQDNAFQFWVPPEALGVTIAVDASTVDNGALICQQGSHRLGMLPHQPSGAMGFSMQLVEPPDLAAHPEVALCMNPGDVAVHHITTVHRSDANRTDRARRQLAIGYRSSRAQGDEAARTAHRALLAELHARNPPP